MIVLIIEENNNPIVKRIPNRLDTMRKIVGNNNIEVLKYNDVLVIFDADSYKKGKMINRFLDDIKIRGTFIIAGDDEFSKDFKDLTEEQIDKYTKIFEKEQEILQEVDEIEVQLFARRKI